MGLFGPPNVEKMKAKRDVDGLIKALGYQKDVSVRKAAASALGEIKDARAIEPLIAALKDNNSDVRKAAAEVLGEFKDARAVEPLIAALKGYVYERTAVAEALAQLGDERAVEPLIAALKGDNCYVRKAVAKVLGEFKDARAVEPLIAALKDNNSDVRKAVADALELIGWRPGQDESGAVYWVFKRDWNKCIEIGVPAVEPLIAALKDNNSDVRKAVASVLGEIKDARAVEPLIAALEDQSWAAREAAAKALSQIGGEKAIGALADATAKLLGIDSGKKNIMEKNGALAVVMNSTGYAMFAPGLSTDDSINENMVRQWINKDLERYPEHRAKASAIEEIVILSDENISPNNLADDMQKCYIKQMKINNWVKPNGLHIFETFLGPVTIYIAYGT